MQSIVLNIGSLLRSVVVRFGVRVRVRVRVVSVRFRVSGFVWNECLLPRQGCQTILVQQEYF